MTTMRERTYKCSVCGSKRNYRILTSTNSFGSMDLDTRRPGMMRNTMHLWIHECPECGYVAEDVNDKTSVSREYLNSIEYRKCDGIRFRSGLAKRFYKHYLISMQDKKLDQAMWACLYAAWASDDAKDNSSAKACRKQCVKLLNRIIKKNDKAEDLYILKCDILRRMGCFKMVITEYEGMKFENELLQKIADFEVKLAKMKNTRVYTVEDVEKGRVGRNKKIVYGKIEEIKKRVLRRIGKKNSLTKANK